MADLKEIMEREYKRCQRDMVTEAAEIARHQGKYDCLQDRACMLREFLQLADFLQLVDKEENTDVHDNRNAPELG